MCHKEMKFTQDDTLVGADGESYIERKVFYCADCDEYIYHDLTYPTGWTYAVNFMKLLKITPEECVEIIKEYKEANKFKPPEEGEND